MRTPIRCSVVSTGSAAGSASSGGEGSSPGTKYRSVTAPWRSGRNRATTRIPVLMAEGSPASTAWSMVVSAPSRRIWAKAKGSAKGCFEVGAHTQVQAATTPAGPTSTRSSGDAGAPVSGSYSTGEQTTRPPTRIPRMRPSRSPVSHGPMTGPVERV